jgi:hypothetical protein
MKLLTVNRITGKVTEQDVTKNDILLGNVDNTSDQNKPHPYFQIAKSAAQTTWTSNTNYFTKATLTTPSLPIGTYRIEAHFKWKTGANRAATFRVLNGVTVLESSEPVSSNIDNNPTDRVVAYLENLTVGSKIINFDFKVGNSVNTSASTMYVSNVTLAFWRMI